MFLLILFAFIDVLLLFYFLTKILNVKIDNKIFILIILIQTLINIALNSFFGIANFYGLLFMIISETIIFKIVTKLKTITLLLFIILGMGILFISELLFLTICNLFNFNMALFVENVFYRFMGGMISKALYFFISIKIFAPIFRKIDFSMLKKIKKKYLYILIVSLIISILLIFASFTFYKYTDIDINNLQFYILGISASIIIITIILFIMFLKTLNYIQKEIEWTFKEKEYQQQKDYITNINETICLLKSQQHEFKNHIACIYGLLEVGKVNEIKDYINNLTQEVIDYNSLIDIENPVISSILNVKLIKAINKNIKINTSINVPKSLSLKNIELTNILGNLLDNAIDACELVENKYINTFMYINKNYLIIKITNSKSPDIKIDFLDKISTTKADAENHGFGMVKIKEVVDRHYGLIRIKDDLSEFETEIAIPLVD